MVWRTTRPRSVRTSECEEWGVRSLQSSSAPVGSELLSPHHLSQAPGRNQSDRLTGSNRKFQTFHKLISKSFFYLLSRLNLPSFRSSFTFLKKKNQVFQNFVLKFCQSRHQCLKSQEEVWMKYSMTLSCLALYFPVNTNILFDQIRRVDVSHIITSHHVIYCSLSTLIYCVNWQGPSHLM